MCSKTVKILGLLYNQEKILTHLSKKRIGKISKNVKLMSEEIQ